MKRQIISGSLIVLFFLVLSFISVPTLYFSSAQVSTPLAVLANCAASNMGNNYNYFNTCANTTTGTETEYGYYFYSATSGYYWNPCGSFNSCSGIIGEFTGPALYWYSEIGDCNAAASQNPSIDWDLMNITDVIAITPNFCEGIPISNQFGIVWQISYAQTGAVIVFQGPDTENSPYVVLTSTVSGSGSMSFSQSPPINFGTLWFSIFSTSTAAAYAPNTGDVVSPFGYIEASSRSVGSGSGLGTNFNLNFSEFQGGYQSPATTFSVIENSCGGYCDSYGDLIIWNYASLYAWNVPDATGLNASFGFILAMLLPWALIIGFMIKFKHGDSYIFLSFIMLTIGAAIATLSGVAPYTMIFLFGGLTAVYIWRSRRGPSNPIRERITQILPQNPVSQEKE